MSKIPSIAVTQQNNVLGTELEKCSCEPQTGFLRDGYCNLSETDHGQHTVCAIMTEEFLDFTKSKGNDLSSARLDYGFPGLKSGDKWCLCASRWIEAVHAGKAPPIILEACHESLLEHISIEQLRKHTYQ